MGGLSLEGIVSKEVSWEVGGSEGHDVGSSEEFAYVEGGIFLPEKGSSFVEFGSVTLMSESECLFLWVDEGDGVASVFTLDDLPYLHATVVGVEDESTSGGKV